MIPANGAKGIPTDASFPVPTKCVHGAALADAARRLRFARR
ncbi:MAG: hypothetical protein ACSLFR_03510 [Solirubrobacteraceae bacterium]